MKNSFRIRHGQPEFNPFGFTPSPPIAVFASAHVSYGVRPRGPHESLKGVRYEAVHGSTATRWIR